MTALSMEERIVDGPEPIERRLLLDSELIAAVFIDPSLPECTLAWPLGETASWSSIAKNYLFDFLPTQDTRPENISLEYWIGDQYSKEELGPNITSKNVEDRYGSIHLRQREEVGKQLQLLQFSSDNTVFEMTFGNDSSCPSRAALLFSAAHARPLVRLFSEFHQNSAVRGDQTIAEIAFHHHTRLRPSSQNILYPIPINE